MRFCQLVKEILLTQGQIALVDDEDYERLNQYKWCARKSGNTYYALRNIGGRLNRGRQHMHRVVMNAPKGLEVNHWDHDGLNNQKYNLIIATHKQNGAYQQKQIRPTSSQYKGVYWNKDKKKWHSRIELNKISKHLGYFDDEIEAAKAYDKAASIHFGEFAKLNFPDNYFPPSPQISR